MTDAHLALQRRLGHTFAKPALLRQALTHRSFSSDHNERLEYLGDSVLNLCISDLLFHKLHQLPEGDLSRVRANLVKQPTLAAIATDLRLAEAIQLGDGEARSGGRSRPSILADALEAVIGAVYLDAGFATARELVLRLFDRVDVAPHMAALERDPKTGLQEWLQGRRLPLPVYRVVATLGAAHQQTFEVACEVADKGLRVIGRGPSRRAAEQAAARSMLQQLESAAGDKPAP